MLLSFGVVSQGTPAVPCRFLRPVSAPSEGSGLLIYFHGGGHTIGSASGYEALVSHLAVRSGLCVLCVEYRCVPFPPIFLAMQLFSPTVKVNRVIEVRLKN